tara:strand:+ start:5492 stop:5953 length:462 start_codon:yes stop_codon:yes gene_type:complete
VTFSPHFIQATVLGTPRPQGSLERTRYGLKYYNQKELMEWRHEVMKELVYNRPDGWDDTAAISVTPAFFFARPKSHYGSGKNAHKLKPSAPEHHTNRPDADKLIRGIGDAIQQAGLIRDDSQIVGWGNWNGSNKFWADGDRLPGLHVQIQALK